MPPSRSPYVLIFLKYIRIRYGIRSLCVRLLVSELPLYPVDQWMGMLHARVRPRYRGTSLIRNCHPVGPYSRTMPRALRGSWGGAFSSERGTPVERARCFVLLTRTVYVPHLFYADLASQSAHRGHRSRPDEYSSKYSGRLGWTKLVSIVFLEEHDVP